MIRALVFDVDMTLVDSSYAMEHSLNLLLEHFHLPPLSRQRLLEVIGLSTPEFFAAITGSADPVYPKYYQDHCRDKELTQLRTFPGTLAVLEGFRRRGLKLAVASNRNNPRRALAATGLEGLMDCVVGALDVERPKTAPDMILTALEVLGASPDEGLYVGDTDLDAMAAAAAGVKSVLMLTSTAREKLLQAGAWQVCSGLAELPDLLASQGLLA